jgi:hypothetical protein
MVQRLSILAQVANIGVPDAFKSFVVSISNAAGAGVLAAECQFADWSYRATFVTVLALPVLGGVVFDLADCMRLNF